CESEPVGPGRENLSRYLDWFTKCKFGSLVRLICHHRARCDKRTKHSEVESYDKTLACIHLLLLRIQSFCLVQLSQPSCSNFLNIFATPLSRFFSFCVALSDTVSCALPRQISCLVLASYKSITRVPTL